MVPSGGCIPTFAGQTLGLRDIQMKICENISCFVFLLHYGLINTTKFLNIKY